jgi:hypothetical protein
MRIPGTWPAVWISKLRAREKNAEEALSDLKEALELYFEDLALPDDVDLP